MTTNTMDVAPPRGWRWAGARSGVRSQGHDTALLVSDRDAVAAGRVTANLCKAPCVRRILERLPGEGLRAVVAVSGNANALAGAAGDAADDALARATAAALGVDERAVLTATTGLIGVPLPVERVAAALPGTVQALGGDPSVAAGAIMTTDTRPKVAARRVLVDGADARLYGIAKGAGMIHPQMATMLAFVTTDLALTPAAADAILGPAVAGSFDRISVDGDQSSNDLVLLLANGASGGPTLDVGDPRLAAVQEALGDLLAESARQIAADGEGASHLVTIAVTGAATDGEAVAAARGISRSNLVKAAVFGADPNWGRVMVAAGQALAEVGSTSSPERWTLSIAGHTMFAGGAPVTYERKAAAEALGAPEVVIRLDLGSGPASATAWGCDLSYDYVRINAEYHT